MNYEELIEKYGEYKNIIDQLIADIKMYGDDMNYMSYIGDDENDIYGTVCDVDVADDIIEACYSIAK